MIAPYPDERLTVAARIVGTLDGVRIGQTNKFYPLDDQTQARLAELIDQYDDTFPPMDTGLTLKVAP